jgi:tetratricopeptide (TPR) repeat protein
MAKRHRPAVPSGRAGPPEPHQVGQRLSGRENRELDLQMQKGYDPYVDGRFAEALEIWFPLWERFRDVIRSRGIRGVDGLEVGPDAVYQGLQAFCNWFQDLADAVENAAIQDPVWWPKALEYSREFRELLPESNPLHLVNMSILEARALDAFGRYAEAEASLERAAAEYPHSEWVWANWGDRWAGNDMGWAGPKDRERARAIYERGLAAGVEEPEILKERLLMLEQERDPDEGGDPK